MRSIVLLIATLGLWLCVEGAAPTKYGDSKYWMQIQRKADSTKATDTYVPEAYHLDSATFAATAYRSDGQDIVVTTAAGALVPREVAYFAKTDNLGEMWLRDPSVNTTTGGTALYLQWGGPTVNVNDTTGVWAQCHGGSVNYTVVLHFAGNVTNISPTTLTVAAYNTPTYGSAGAPTGQYITLNGSNQWVGILHVAALAGGNGTTDNPLTFIGWIYDDDYGANQFYICKGMAAATYDYAYYAAVTTALSGLQLFDGGTANYSGRKSKKPTAATWRQAAITYSGTAPTTNGVILRNGIRVDTATWTSGSYTAMEGDADTLGIGRAATSYMDGNVSEWRLIIGTALDSTLIRNAYANEAGFATNASFTIGTVYSRVASLDSITPSSGLAGDTVRVRGSGFGLSQGIGLVFVVEIGLSTYVSWDDTLIVGILGSRPAATGDVRITNADLFSDTLVDAFTYSESDASLHILGRDLGRSRGR